VAASVLQYFGWQVAPHIGLSGFYLNTEVLAELTAPLLLWAFWSNRWVLTGIMSTSLLLCHSRIAVFVVACGLLFGWRAPRTVKVACIVVLMIAGVAAVFMIADGPGKYLSGMTRIMYWGTAVLSIVPGGRGLAWWAAAHPFPFEEFVHSDVLQAMLELGLGSVFFLAIPVMVLRRSGGLAERAAYIGICVEAVFSFPMHLPATGFLAAVLTGYLARRSGDVRVAGSESRVENLGAIRWSAAIGRCVDWWDGCSGDGVPARPAHSEYASDHSAARKGAA
jgi:hypothetical protein